MLDSGDVPKREVERQEDFTEDSDRSKQNYIIKETFFFIVDFIVFIGLFYLNI